MNYDAWRTFEEEYGELRAEPDEGEIDDAEHIAPFPRIMSPWRSLPVDWRRRLLRSAGFRARNNLRGDVGF